MHFNDFAEFEGNPSITLGEKNERNFLKLKITQELPTYPKITKNCTKII